MVRSRVLVVEDDAALAELFLRVLTDAKFEVSHAPNRADALQQLATSGVDVLLTDLHFPDGDGVTLIEEARRIDPRIAIVAVTGFGSIPLAVRAVRQGAYEFLTKPVEPAALVLTLTRAIEARTLRGEVERLRAELALKVSSTPIVGKSPALGDIVALIDRAADSDVPVLVTGPSGSGKELVARGLHDRSARRDKPFVAVNAAALPDNLLESELFGYVKGAFTDAKVDKVGLFQAANGGTLFLDEIGDLPLGLQAKLLRVLQEREVRPLGATRSVPFDIRLLAATHHDLKRDIAEGRFRSDLYYRVAVLEIKVPPLSERPEDILPLAEHFLARAVSRTGRSIRGFSALAAGQLTHHDWPGNVRELENVVERAVALSRDEWISPDDLPQGFSTAERNPFREAAESLMTLEQVERNYVRHVLERLGGNKKRAAAVLGINRRTIQRWLGEDEDEERTTDV